MNEEKINELLERFQKGDITCIPELSKCNEDYLFTKLAKDYNWATIVSLYQPIEIETKEGKKIITIFDSKKILDKLNNMLKTPEEKRLMPDKLIKAMNDEISKPYNKDKTDKENKIRM